MNAFKRFGAAACVATSLTIGGIVLTAAPASAASVTSVTDTASDVVTTVADQTKHVNILGAYYFDEAWNKLVFDIKATGPVKLEPNNPAFTGWSNNTFTAGDESFQRLSDTHLRLTVSGGEAYNWTSYSFTSDKRVNVQRLDPTAATRTNVTTDLVSMTPKSTNVAVAQTSDPIIDRLITWGSGEILASVIDNATNVATTVDDQTQYRLGGNGAGLSGWTFTEDYDKLTVEFTATGPVKLVPSDPAFTGWTGDTYTNGVNTWTRYSDTSVRLTVDVSAHGQNFNGINISQSNGVAVERLDPTANTQTTLKADLTSVTPKSTGIREYVTGASVDRVITWGDVDDTPVIAPAIAGIALLGAAGVGAGAFAKRRRDGKASA